MTKLTLNLNDSETEKLINIEKLTLEKCQSLEVHNILKCNYKIRKQFYLVVFPLDFELLRISLYVFKKKFNFEKFDFEETIGICRKNFVLDETLLIPNCRNWQEIQNKNVEWEDINISYLEEHNIKYEDYHDYISLYHDYKYLDFEVSSIWGENTSIWCIDWIITLENIVKRDYGIDYTDDEEKDLPEHYTFLRYSINQIYYPYFNLNCYLYKYISQYSLYKCDSCQKYFGTNQKEKDLWHNPYFGDICNFCYQRIKKDYLKKIRQKFQKLLLLAKKKSFQKDLEITIRILNHKKIPVLDIDKKNSISKKVISEILKDSKEENCGICLDKLRYDIKAGSCGHCFHATCIDKIIGDKCPMCRTQTDFFKLHL